MIELKFKRSDSYADQSAICIPKVATSGSACFDIHACLQDGYVTGYPKLGRDPYQYEIIYGTLKVPQLARMMVPTGIHLEIPEGYSARLYPRSGNSIKKGYGLCNSVGIIDSDFREELKVLLINFGIDSVIKDKDRIAQLELVKVEPIELLEVNEISPPNSERVGGFGSTGS